MPVFYALYTTICSVQEDSLLLFDAIDKHVNLLVVETDVTNNGSGPTQVSTSALSRQCTD